MTSFHGDPILKEKCLADFSASKPRITWGLYSGHEDESVHKRASTAFGLPEWLSYLEHKIGKKLPTERQQAWPGEFISAIPVGVPYEELVLVDVAYRLWVLESLRFDRAKCPQVGAAVDEVASLLRRGLAGDVATGEEWTAARDAALRAFKETDGGAAGNAAKAAEDAIYNSGAFRLQADSVPYPLEQRQWLLSTLPQLQPRINRLQTLVVGLKNTLWRPVSHFVPCLVVLAVSLLLFYGVSSDARYHLRLDLFGETVPGMVVKSKDTSWDDGPDGHEDAYRIDVAFKTLTGEQVMGVTGDDHAIPYEFDEQWLPAPVRVDYLPDDPSTCRVRTDKMDSTGRNMATFILSFVGILGVGGYLSYPFFKTGLAKLKSEQQPRAR